MYDNELLKLNYGEKRPSRSMTSPDDPNGIDLGLEWFRGSGPRQRILGANSDFARTFAEAPSVRAHLKKAAADWRQRRGGQIADGDSYTNYGADFGPWQVITDTFSPNLSSQFVGSFRLDGARRDDKLYWTADNKSGVHSATYGSQLDKAGLPSIPDASWNSGPLSNKYQRIDLVTDLDGNPLP